MGASEGILVEERILLADTFDAASPEQPVVCEGWTAKDLLAHVVAQDCLRGVPVLLATPVVAAFAPRRRDIARNAVLERRACRLAEQTSYPDLVGLLRLSPPPLFTLPLVILTRLVETWVHHEDLRRMQDSAPRRQDERTRQALWSAARLFSHAVSLPPDVSMALETPGDRTIRIGRRKRHNLTISGEPGEVLLYLMGRDQYAEVRLASGTDGVKRVDGWQLL